MQNGGGFRRIPCLAVRSGHSCLPRWRSDANGRSFFHGKAQIGSLIGSIIASLAILAALVLAIPRAGASPVSAPRVARIPGNVLPALSKATPIGNLAGVPAEASQPITVTLVLKRDDQKGFDRYLHEIYDPNSPNYHHWLTQAGIARRFGPSRSEYQSVLDYMGMHGFTLVQGSENRLTLTMRGSRAGAEGAFDVNIRDYRIGSRSFYANDRDPALPEQIASKVEAVGGLSSLAQPRSGQFELEELQLELVNLFLEVNDLIDLAEIEKPILEGIASVIKALRANNGPRSGRGPGGGAAKDASGVTINPASCTWAGDNGAGQTIGLLEFDSFNRSDVVDFLSLMGFPATLIDNLSKVDVNGGVAPGPSQNEVLLDIDAILAAAPGARVVVYDAPFAGAGGSFQPVLNKMVNDGVNIISNSFSYCEDQTTAADAASIDSIFQNAAAAGISVFNAGGDTGTTCLDGAANTVGVPADSPNATAVGGTSLKLGPGLTYDGETWWDGSKESPLNGQGGFGNSKFFAVPPYQSGLASGGRSVPDVSVNADPVNGYEICQAGAGGCPTGLLNGGTSGGAPTWAAFQAILNQSVGQPLGFINPTYYGFANTSAFHNAASMGTDFAHVGLGSPNLDALHLLLCGQTPGTPAGGSSQVIALFNGLEAFQGGVPADGATTGRVQVTLRDATGNAVGGKTVTLAASSGSSTISPSSGTTSPNDGSFTFTVKDLTPETVTYSATDQSDSATLTQQATIPFVVPPATVASISAAAGSEPADGATADTITVTVQDSLGRPTPGKLVRLSQMAGSNVGKSAITAPSPAVTDSSGQIQFQVTDLITENVTYTATDVSDGNLPVPGSATVDFTSGPGGCATSQPGNVVGTVNTADGFEATTVASGFVVNNGNQGFSFNCFGAWGMAWDAAGNLYVTDWPTGKIYKFGPAGGVADASHLFTTVKAPASGVVIDPAGNMFASEASVSGAFGDIVPVNLTTGAVGRAIASNIECLGSMALNPSLPALYAIDFCNVGQGGSDNIWQVTGIDGSSPSTAVYSQVPSSNVENLQVTVAPDGTLYDLFCASGVGCEIARVSTASPPVVTTLATAGGAPITLFGSLGITPGGMQASGDAQFIIFPQPQQDGLGEGIQTIDLTGPAPAPAVQITTSFSAGLSNFAIGPDGCLYIAGGPTVQRVTRADGTCGFGPVQQPPAIALTPTTVTPNPAQGSSQSFTATLHYAGTTNGVPVTLQAAGANPQAAEVANADATGQAMFSYVGAHQGTDNVLAFSTIGGSTVVSNTAKVTWSAGKDVTFLTLNPSPKGGMPGQPTTVVASLTDASQNPAAAASGQPVNFTLGSAGCSATTDANGMASCALTPGGSGMQTLTASFAGTSTLVASSDSKGFTVVVGGGPIPNPGGAVVLVAAGNNSGAPGATVNAGSFSYTAAGGTNLNKQSISSVSLAISDPGLFQSLTVTPSSGAPVTVSAPNIAGVTKFVFSPPLTVGPAQALTFAVSGILSGGTARLELGGVAFAGMTGAPPHAHGCGRVPLGMLLAVCLLGAALMPGRRRIALMAALVLVLALTAIACTGGGSSGPGAPATSQQSVMGLEASENGSSLTASGVPLTLGTLTRT